jgi:hypothetical protein
MTKQTNAAISLKAGETYDWEILFGVREIALLLDNGKGQLLQ